MTSGCFRQVITFPNKDALGLCTCLLQYLQRPSSLIGQTVVSTVCSSFSAEDAKFNPCTGKQPAHTLVLAMQLMRMISCSCGRPEFLQRSGMLLRCVHVLHDILAACPTVHFQSATGSAAQDTPACVLHPFRIAPTAGTTDPVGKIGDLL